jgi:hypothetical protein
MWFANSPCIKSVFKEDSKSVSHRQFLPRSTYSYMYPHRAHGAREPAGDPGGVSYTFCFFSYTIRILMYRDVSCIYPVGYTYLECILMYLKCILNPDLKCSVTCTFKENSCILTFCMYFTRIPNESKIHFGIHQDTCILLASYVSHWIHNTIHQDTCILMYLQSWTLRHVTIHQDTSGYKITIHVSWMRHDDTSGYMFKIHHDACILDALSEPRWLDTHKIRSRCNADTFRIRILGSFYLPCCPRS